MPELLHFFQECELDKFENLSHRWWNIKVLKENLTSILERELKPNGVNRNMKGCILEANLEGQGW